MTTSTLTVTDFVLARIAEDEREARVCLTQWENGEGGTSRRWRRQLAECAAMRKIVERCDAVDYAMPSTHLAHGILAAVASIWSDHPDWREEWA